MVNPICSVPSKSLLFLAAALLPLLAAKAGGAMSTADEEGSTTDSSERVRLLLHPERFLVLPEDAHSTFIEPSLEWLTDVGSSVRREIDGHVVSANAVTATSGGNGLLRRGLQTGTNGELTFEDVCGFLVQIINEGSEGAIFCNCTAETNTLGCLTPTPVCENTLTNICASLSLEMSFLDNFGASSMGVCVNYTGVSDPSGPFRDGCVSADFNDDGTTVDTCVATFDDANGIPTNCTTCTGCGNVTTGAGFSLDCSNLYPGATTNGCYTTGGTAEKAAALFPAADSSFENGNSNGTSSGGSGGEGSSGGSGGGSSGSDGGSGVSGGGNNGSSSSSGSNGTGVDTDGDTEDDSEHDDHDGHDHNSTSGNSTVTGGGGTTSGGSANAAGGTSSGRPSFSTASSWAAALVVSIGGSIVVALGVAA